MQILYSIVYILCLCVGVFVFGRIYPREWLRIDRFPFRCYGIEDEGRIYNRIGIMRWKTKLPDISVIITRFIPDFMPRKRLDGSEKLSVLIEETCIAELSRLEKENCPNPDEVAGCFGQLMGELLVYEEDLWSPALREMGMALGRFIYLADAAIDYRKDIKKGSYNPFAAMGGGEDFDKWEQYLVLAMALCTEAYERLPLVEDKGILDNILYSGIWLSYRQMQKSGKENQDG